MSVGSNASNMFVVRSTDGVVRSGGAAIFFKAASPTFNSAIRQTMALTGTIGCGPPAIEPAAGRTTTILTMWRTGWSLPPPGSFLDQFACPLALLSLSCRPPDETKSDEFGLSAADKGLEPWVVVEIVELDPGEKFCFRKSFPGCFLQPVERRRPVAEMVVDDGAE